MRAAAGLPLMNGTGTVNLTPLSSGNDAGIVIFQDRADTQPLTFSASAVGEMSGTIYAAAAQLVESGNARLGTGTNALSIVVDSMNLSGSVLVGGSQSDAVALALVGPASSQPGAAIGAGTLLRRS